MQPIFILLISFLCSLLLSACSTKTNKEKELNSFHFVAENYNSQLAHPVNQVITGYQSILNGLYHTDTVYVQQSTKHLRMLTDSLSTLQVTVDSNLHKIWIDNLSNFNAELQALEMSTYSNGWDEAKMSINMCGIQLINLLAQIGYREQPIYIFNEPDRQLEDGYTWLSLQKTSTNPFHPADHHVSSAQNILQECK